jgi:hypothetical protein
MAKPQFPGVAEAHDWTPRITLQVVRKSPPFFLPSSPPRLSRLTMTWPSDFVVNYPSSLAI